MVARATCVRTVPGMRKTTKTPNTRGHAGAHARKLHAQYRRKYVQAGLLSFLCAVVAAAALTAGNILVAAIAVSGGYLSWQAFQNASTRLGQTRVGFEAEDSVAKAIQASGPYHVILGADLGGPGDVDAVVIHPAGLAVVEIKAGGGNVRVENGAVITGKGRRIPKDPLGQAKQPAAALSVRTGQPVTPILCVQWMHNRAFVTADGVTVCSAKQLPGVLRAMGHPLDPQRAKRIAAGIRVKR